jgi:hypothetical protein
VDGTIAETIGEVDIMTTTIEGATEITETEGIHATVETGPEIERDNEAENARETTIEIEIEVEATGIVVGVTHAEILREMISIRVETKDLAKGLK